MENSEEFNKQIKFSTTETLNFEMKSSAKEKLLEDKNFTFLVLLRKLGKKNSREKAYTKKRKLKETIMYFENEVHNFTRIDLHFDVLEVTVLLLSSDNKLYEQKPKQYKFKDLLQEADKNMTKQTLWTLNSQSILQVTYSFTKETVSTPIIETYYKSPEEIKILNSLQDNLELNNKNSITNTTNKEGYGQNIINKVNNTTSYHMKIKKVESSIVKKESLIQESSNVKINSSLVAPISNVININSKINDYSNSNSNNTANRSEKSNYINFTTNPNSISHNQRKDLTLGSLNSKITKNIISDSIAGNTISNNSNEGRSESGNSNTNTNTNTNTYSTTLKQQLNNYTSKSYNFNSYELSKEPQINNNNNNNTNKSNQISIDNTNNNFSKQTKIENEINQKNEKNSNMTSTYSNPTNNSSGSIESNNKISNPSSPNIRSLNRKGSMSNVLTEKVKEEDLLIYKRQSSVIALHNSNSNSNNKINHNTNTNSSNNTNDKDVEITKATSSYTNNSSHIYDKRKPPLDNTKKQSSMIYNSPSSNNQFKGLYNKNRVLNNQTNINNQSLLDNNSTNMQSNNNNINNVNSNVNINNINNSVSHVTNLNLNNSSGGNEPTNTSLNTFNRPPIIRNLYSADKKEKHVSLKKLLSSSPSKEKDKEKEGKIPLFSNNTNFNINNINDSSISTRDPCHSNLFPSHYSHSHSSNYNNQFQNPFSKVEFIELTYEDYFEYEVGDTFIEAIFLAGLPKSGNKIILDSEQLLPACKHKECGYLNAYKPEILFKFPEKGRSALELTTISASLCFTKGIKLCFSKEESLITKQDDYVNMMTNEAGERFYQFNYHFYVKHDFLQFQKDYDCNPIKDISSLRNPNISSDKLMAISEISIRDYVYIPYCLCLVSKFPFTNQIFTCLESLVTLVFREKEKDKVISNNAETGKYNNLNSSLADFHEPVLNINNINLTITINKSTNNNNIKDSINFNSQLFEDQFLFDFIKHITYEIPIPPEKEFIGKKMNIFFPFIEIPVELCLPDYELPLFAFDLSSIFDVLSAENIVVIYHLMLHEQRLLFIGNSEKQLCKTLEILRCIIYPLIWNNTYIPVLSEDLIKFLQSFIPFIMGIESSLLFLAKEHIIESQEGLFIVNLEKNTVETSIKAKKVTKKSLKTFINEFNIDEYEKLENTLKELQSLRESALKEKKQLNNKRLNRLFIKSFCTYIIGYIGDFQKYLSYIDGYACFNLELFMSSKNPKYNSFLMEIVQSQNFNSFIQNSPFKFTYFNKLVQRNSGKRTTNVGKSKDSGIMSIFSKKKYFEISLNEITLAINNVNNNNNNNNNNLNNTSFDPNISILNKLKAENPGSLRGKSISNNPNSNNNTNNINCKDATGRDSVSKSKRSVTDNLSLNNNNIIKDSKSNGNNNDNLNISTVQRFGNTSVISNKSNKSNKSETQTPDVSQEISELNIPPFYLRDLPIDASLIDSIMAEYMKKSVVSDNVSRVFDYNKLSIFINKMNNFNEDQERFKRLLITNDLKGDVTFVKRTSSRKHTNDNADYQNNNLINNRKNQIFKVANHNDIAKEKENDKLRDKINDLLKKILTSQVVSESEFKSSNSFFQTKFGRRTIANVIFQDKFKNHKYHQLSDKGFELMKHIISNSLILSEFTEEQLPDVIKTTKACFHYYKLNKKPYYIYQELCKTQVKIWDNDNLWFKWFELEVLDCNDEDLIQLNKNSDNFYFSKVLPVFSIMKDLALDIKFVQMTISKIASIYIKEELLREELKKTVEKQYNFQK